MLRITVHKDPDALTFELEGRLAGPWVRELDDCLHSALASLRKPVLRFDLTGVTYVDAAGKEFLAARYTDGVQFIARGCLMRALVAEITAAPLADCGRPEDVSQT